MTENREVLASGIQVTTIHKNGSQSVIPFDPSAFYKGIVEGQALSHAYAQERTTLPPMYSFIYCCCMNRRGRLRSSTALGNRSLFHCQDIDQRRDVLHRGTVTCWLGCAIVDCLWWFSSCSLPIITCLTPMNTQWYRTKHRTCSLTLWNTGAGLYLIPD